MKTIGILGSTGSIGTQSLDVAKKRGYRVSFLTAGSNAALMEQQIREFHPEKAALLNEAKARELKMRVSDTSTRILSGEEGICECAANSGADIVINAIVGLAGLRPTLAVLNAGKNLALANKESLVAGGELVLSEAEKHHAKILPVDSEHSAIFQCLQGKPSNAAVKKIILTASGGPFFGKTEKDLEKVTVKQALNHPNWSMGAKITIDSATMFNKGLELIEAVRLFHVRPSQVDIVVHRESIVHSLVMYDDNSVIAQLGLPDMRIPIQYALTYPERYESPVEELDLAKYGTLTFFAPDEKTFRCIDLCRQAVEKGGLYPAAVNSANEEANAMFRAGQIRFLEIPRLIEAASAAVHNQEHFTIDDVFSIDRQMRETVRALAKE